MNQPGILWFHTHCEAEATVWRTSTSPASLPPPPYLLFFFFPEFWIFKKVGRAHSYSNTNTKQTAVPVGRLARFNTNSLKPGPLLLIFCFNVKPRPNSERAMELKRCVISTKDLALLKKWSMKDLIKVPVWSKNPTIRYPWQWAKPQKLKLVIEGENSMRPIKSIGCHKKNRNLFNNKGFWPNYSNSNQNKLRVGRSPSSCRCSLPARSIPLQNCSNIGQCRKAKDRIKILSWRQANASKPRTSHTMANSYSIIQSKWNRTLRTVYKWTNWFFRRSIKARE